MASVKNCEIKRGGQENQEVTQIHLNLLLKILSSTYTIAAISWSPLWFHNFSTPAILNKAVLFLQLACFQVYYIISKMLDLKSFTFP